MASYQVEGILSGQEAIADLFKGSPDIENPDVEETQEQEPDENEVITEDEQHPESVGNEEQDTEGKEQDQPKDIKGGSSPKIYSSIASLMREDGTLPDLTDEEIDGITDAETLYAAVNKQITASMEDRIRKADEALNAGVEPSVIQQYQNAIDSLSSINEEQLIAEDDNGKALRKNLIMLEFTNKGFSRERAEKEATKSFSAGTDIEDAKEYLENLKNYYKDSYQKEIDTQKKAQEEAEAETKKNVETLKTNMLDSKRKLFGELEIDNVTRQKAFDALTKPTYRGKDGNYLTAVNKYINEHPLEFQETIGLIYQMTNGFKEVGSLFKGAVKKEKKKAISELETAIQNTQRNSAGVLDLGFSKDSNANFKGWDFADV